MGFLSEGVHFSGLLGQFLAKFRMRDVDQFLRALFHPANRALLDAGEPSARTIRLEEAAEGLTAPLHPGAERFYRDMGKLAAPAKRR